MKRRRFLLQTGMLGMSSCHSGETQSEVISILISKDLSKLRLYFKSAAGVKFGNVSTLHKELVNQHQQPMCIMNAGIYGPDVVPLGLHVEDGLVVQPLNIAEGTGNFYLKPNGVFWIGTDGKAAVLETHKFEAKKLSPRLAIQSGPLLVEENVIHPAFKAGSENCTIRNGIGVTSNGRVVLAISSIPMNLHDFASHFRNKLGCPNALYLDGAISQSWRKGESVENLPKQSFAGMLVVLE